MPKRKNIADKVDKRRRARVQVGRKENGKPDYKYVQGKSKAELERNKKELERLAARGRLMDKDITVFDYSVRFIERLKSAKRSKATLDMYRSALNEHILPVIGTRYLATVKTEELQAIVDRCAGKSASLIRQVTLTIGRLFRRALADGLIEADPSASLEKPEAKEAKHRRALTVVETEATLKIGSLHEEGLLLLFLYYLGPRIGEAKGSQWQDMDWIQHQIHICRDIDTHDNDQIGKVKSYSSDRFIPVPDPLYYALQNLYLSRILEPDIETAFIFPAPRTGGPLGHATYKRRWRRLMEAMRAETGAKNTELTAHFFRHNYASILYAAGVPLEVAANWLGHSDINVTRKIYLHLAHETLVKQSVELLKFFNGCQMVARERIQAREIEKAKELGTA